MMTGIDPNAALGDLAPIIKRAAAGDIEAQRMGRSFAIQDMADAESRRDYAMGQGHAAEAMFWARLAASHGFEDDAVILAAVLTQLAEFWGFDRRDDSADWGNLLLAEAVTILDDLAANGNEAAATAINEMGARVSPHIFQKAKEIA
ncbi:MAG: hypothetical protein ACOY4N_10925 [Pseudomonadota bacterium]|uniref:hypothetical protein n=1 Tax=Sphingobium xenophagum TaxID=121428 RepID=UPI0036D30202|tara:strand:+ start:1987 stop:2427 length:441 start_codon:yes stop_codon:yes gene_type:complete